MDTCKTTFSISFEHAKASLWNVHVHLDAKIEAPKNQDGEE